MRTKILAIAALLLLSVVGCQTESNEEMEVIANLKEIPMNVPVFVDLGKASQPTYMRTESGEIVQVIPFMAEYITTDNSEETGNTVYFNDRGNRQNDADFVVDPYYFGLLDFLDNTNDISYYVDNSKPATNLISTMSNAAIDRSMDTWDAVTCSEGLNIFERPYDPSVATGIFAGSNGYGNFIHPIFGWVADIVHVGWITPEFFNIIRPDGANNILAVTITYVVFDPGLIDQDNNGKADVWFREIYYNDNFPWNVDESSGHFDVETVALHEVGHGLSQGHFGKAFRNKSNGRLHFAPRAVMNSVYSGVQRLIEGTDQAGHCSIWGNWPNN